MFAPKKRVTAAALAGVAALLLGTAPAPAGAMSAGGLVSAAGAASLTAPSLATAHLPAGQGAFTRSDTTPAEQPNFTPATIDPVENSVVGVAQPIIITFPKAPQNRAHIEKFVQVEVYNSQHQRYDIPGLFRWWSPTQLRWRPLSFWPAHTIIKVTVGKSIRTFRVGARHVAVADDKTHMITVYSDGTVIRRVPTSMGKPGHETPNGFYYIGDKHRHIVMDSSTYGVPVTAPEGYRTDVEYALRMSYSGIFLHAAPWSVGAQGSYDSSHGCLNVSTEHGRWFFENWRQGDVVRVINSTGTLSKHDGMGDWAPGAY